MDADYAWSDLQTVLPNEMQQRFWQHTTIKREGRGGGGGVFKRRAWRVDEVGNMEAVKDLIHIRSWKWLKGNFKKFNYSFYEWMMHPMECIKELWEVIGKLQLEYL